MNLQITRSTRNYKRCEYLCYNEENFPIKATFSGEVEEMFIPTASAERKMVVYNMYDRVRDRLEQLGGRVVMMSSSKLENIVDKFPVLYIGNVDWTLRNRIKDLGYTKSFKDHHARFLEKYGSYLSAGLIFYAGNHTGNTFSGSITNMITGKQTRGFLNIPDPAKFTRITPNITFYDFETHSPLYDMFAGVGKQCKGDIVYTTTMNQKGKTKFIVSFNRTPGIKVWADEHMETFVTVDYMGGNKLRDFIQESIATNVYAITINIEWGQVDVFWTLKAYILKSLKTNILSGWNIDSFDNIHMIDKCPEHILSSEFGFHKNDFFHSDDKLCEKAAEFDSSVPFHTDFWISCDMSIAYAMIKNPKDGRSLKSAGKTVGVQKINMSYDDIGLITRYNHFMWFKDMLTGKNGCQFKKSHVSKYIPYIDIENISEDMVLSFLEKIMLKDNDDTSAYIKRYEDVQKYALYDVLVPEAVCDSIDFVNWLFLNASASFIGLGVKVNRGISYVLATYLSRTCFKRNMYFSTAVEEKYSGTGGYVAPILKFRLKHGVVCDLDANSMYPGMMTGYNISSGTVYDDPVLVKAMIDQGYVFHKDKADHTMTGEPLLIETNKLVSMEDITKNAPRVYSDEQCSRPNLDRQFKCLLDISVFGYTVQFYPFCMIGGILKDITYHHRGAFLTGDLNCDMSDISKKLKNESDIKKHMMSNYNSFKPSKLKPTHIKLVSKSVELTKKRTVHYVEALEVYSHSVHMVTVDLHKTPFAGGSVSINRKFVYDRDTWIAQIDHAAVFPSSLVTLAKTRKIYKTQMKPLIKIKEVYERGEGAALTAKQTVLLKELDLKQMATKVLMNAEYGSLSTTGVKSNNNVAAEMITTYGRRSILDVYRSLRMFGGYITSGDTDSAMACFPFIDIKVLDEEFKMQKEINMIKISGLRLIVNNKNNSPKVTEQARMDIDKCIKWNDLHWSHRLKNSLIDLGNMHMRNTHNVMTLGADGVFIFFLTLAKKNYLRMDVCTLVFEPIGIPFIKGGFSEIYKLVGLEILKIFGHRDNTMSIVEIQKQAYKRFDGVFSDKEYQKYVDARFDTDAPPPFVEIKRKLNNTQCRNAIIESKRMGFDPSIDNELWYVSNGVYGIDFRAMSNMRRSRAFFLKIKENHISKMNTYFNNKKVFRNT